ncbi:MAG: hypothetical protein FWE67_13300 [Planctomycetaceae bacterium]|nr:hypothetical protein [Planctomycetaceae bacterium]
MTKYLLSLIVLCGVVLSLQVSAAATVSDEVRNDWVKQDELFRKSRAPNVTVPFSPEHTHAVLENAAAMKSVRKELLDKISALKEKVKTSKPEEYEKNYFEARKITREIVFAQLQAADLKKLVFLKKHDALNLPFLHMCDQFYGFSAVPGGGLFTMDLDAESITKLAKGILPPVKNLLENSVVESGKMKGRKLENGAFLSPEVSFDGKTIYFAWCEVKPSDKSWKNEKSVDYYHEWSETTCYHIFKCNADGSGLCQLTDGSVNDFDPCELPDGRIAFISERRGGFLRCGRYCPTYTLFAMNPDGSEITPLSFHETHEWQPSVDNNGMLVYTRWDYVDRDTNVAHHLWVCFPDGRDPRSFHSNYPLKRESRPWLEADIRAIPNSHKYVAVAAAHHGHAFGSLVLIDQRLEDDGAVSQIQRLTPEVPFPESETSLKDIAQNMIYGTPYPLSEDAFLCVYDSDAKNRGIYYLDAAGHRELIYRDTSISCHSPLPLSARTKPPVIPSMVSSIPNQTATAGVINVYQSDVPLPPVKIKALRIVQLFPKSTPVPDDPRIGIAAQTNARGVLGTVPVEDDGSAYFEVPVGKPIYFQTLDENGRAVQSMRSITYLHSGEQLTCIGCHEDKRTNVSNTVRAKAFQRKPSVIQNEGYGTFPLNYVQLVQPVLDSHCVECHQKEKALDLSGIPDQQFGWTRSYNNLAKKYGFYFNTTNGSIKDPIHGGSRTIPGQFGAIAAPLQKYLVKEHYGVQLSTEERHRIDLWLDCNSVFYGTYDNPRVQSLGKDVLPSLE